ncbi:MAG: HAD hydrolase-like protein [Spirochaetia bacterium]
MGASVDHTDDLLTAFHPQHDYFVGIDSDGCVFDSMEIKHKECFCPQFINRFDLQAGAKYAREIWEFVNLYSSTRGVNRFKGVHRALKLVETHPELVRRGVNPPKLPDLSAWLEHETKLGNPQLAEEVKRTGSAGLRRVLEWSEEVNETVKRIVRNVPPFPGVREVLEHLKPRADIVVVSQTPEEALKREWRDQAIDGFVALIAGQEHGTKAEHLAATAGAEEDGRYPAGHVLMIGDAPGDLAAARNVGALFFPILPGDEESSWNRLRSGAMTRFFDQTYAGEYQATLLDEFERVLPTDPPWRK